MILPVIILFLLVSGLSFYSINYMQGNARVVNYVGIVRGATQKLIKQELMGHKDDALVQRLDSIIDELLTGEGPNGLIRLNDDEFLGNMADVRVQWGLLKQEIGNVRNGGDKEHLFTLSQEYFQLADRTVSSAEAYSEKQVGISKNILMFVNIIFIILIFISIANTVRTAAIKRKADHLDKIAYVDNMTQLPNRGAFEKLAARMNVQPCEGKIAVFMFDMNNLKLTNDGLGHKEGDKLITDFASIIKEEANGYGEVYRYGGDEFVAVFEAVSQDCVQQYLLRVNERIIAYNILCADPLGKISFAVGFVVESMAGNTLDMLISKADRRMYDRKRQMKDNKDIVPSYTVEEEQGLV